jgi:hypothetical protein
MYLTGATLIKLSNLPVTMDYLKNRLLQVDQVSLFDLLTRVVQHY